MTNRLQLGEMNTINNLGTVCLSDMDRTQTVQMRALIAVQFLMPR
jgi:hypothetical protein